jgi:hypothetical protein
MAVPIPIVPAPNTTAVSPIWGCALPAVRWATVNGSMREAVFEEIVSLTA